MGIFGLDIIIVFILILLGLVVKLIDSVVKVCLE